MRAVLFAVVFRVLGLAEILRTLCRRLSPRVVSLQAQTQLPRAQRTQLTQKIRHTLHAAGAVTLTRALQTLLSLHQNRRVQQLAQTARTQQLSQQSRVQRQCGGAAFGGGRIAVVEVLGNVLKEQGACKRRRVVRLNLQHGHRPRLQRTVHLNQRRNIVHILQTLARRLQKHRKIRVLTRHIQQLRRTLTLLPQRGALTRITARQQQGTRRILTEPRRKKRRIAHAFGDNCLQLVRVEEEQVSAGRYILHSGQTQNQAVITRHDGGVHPVPLLNAGAHRQRPGRVHPVAERRVQDHAPIAQFVAVPLHNHAGVGGDRPGGFALLTQVGEQVIDRPGVQSELFELLAGGGAIGGVQAGEGARERTRLHAQGVGAAYAVTVPERQARGLTGSGGDPHRVMRNFFDAPTARAEGDDLAGAGFVHHFFVELTHTLGAALFVAADQVDGEEPAVGNRAAAGDGEALRTGATLNTAGGGFLGGGAIPDDARAQFGELVGGVASGEHFEYGVEEGARQFGVGCAAA